jgi:uncharacterized membrane protein YtjA (UPF0391 family)
MNAGSGKVRTIRADHQAGPRTGLGGPPGNVEPNSGLDRFRPKDQGVETAMSILKWALIMLIVSVLAAVFGFTDLSAASADVARVLFFIFIVIFLVLLVIGLFGMRAARGP